MAKKGQNEMNRKDLGELVQDIHKRKIILEETG